MDILARQRRHRSRPDEHFSLPVGPLGQQPEVVGVGGGTLEEILRPLRLPGEGQALNEPVRVDKEAAVAAPAQRCRHHRP